MTTAQFFEKFDLIADAPDAIPRMRELILNLAMAGELRTEPIKPVREWKTQLLGDIASLITKGATPTSYGHTYQSSGVPFIKVENVADGAIDHSSIQQFISEETHDFLKRSQLAAGDILFSIAGTIGKTCVVTAQDTPANTNQALAIIRGFHDTFEVSFLKMQLDSFVANKIKARARGGAMPNVSLGDIRNLAVTVPPLAEQKRIVAKVDELMALCDQLEAQQQERETKHTALAQATLARLAETPTPTNLNLLFHSSFSIQPSDLRKTILTLAVKGKLVPPSLNEQGQQTFVPSECLDLPAIPAHWSWSDLGTLVTRMDSGWSPACDSERAKKSEWGVLKTTAVQLNEYREEENKRLPRSLSPKPEAEVCDGDILFTRAGPMNRVGIVCVARPTRPKLIISDKIIRFHLVAEIDPSYAALALNTGFSNTFIQTLKSGMAASQVNISQPKLRTIPIPLPPLAEQKRIVAKVEELMALVDALEAQQAAADQAATHLLDAVVSELSAAA